MTLTSTIPSGAPLTGIPQRPSEKEASTSDASAFQRRVLDTPSGLSMRTSVADSAPRFASLQVGDTAGPPAQSLAGLSAQGFGRGHTANLPKNNTESIKVLANHFDTLSNGKDGFTKGDLQREAAGPNLALAVASDKILKNEDLFNKMDKVVGGKGGGKSDGKIGLEGLARHLQDIPLTETERAAVQALQQGSALFAGDDKFRLGELKELAQTGLGPQNEEAGDELKAAADYIAAHRSLQLQLDTRSKWGGESVFGKAADAVGGAALAASAALPPGAALAAGVAGTVVSSIMGAIKVKRIRVDDVVSMDDVNKLLKAPEKSTMNGDKLQET